LKIFWLTIRLCNKQIQAEYQPQAKEDFFQHRLRFSVKLRIYTEAQNDLDKAGNYYDEYQRLFSG
tara:strand:- start:681 stop:875 length:195 start_codon:yes stop_codon:yes gene_type:complete